MSATTINGADTASRQQHHKGDRMQQAPPTKSVWGKGALSHKPGNNTNGTDKALHSAPKQLPKSPGDAHKEQAHDRTLFLLAHLVGKDATITLKNGEQFTGVLSGASLEAPKAQYIMKMTRRTQMPSQQQTNGASDQLGEYIGEGDDHAASFDVQDTADLFVANVTTAAAPSLPNGSAGSFLTDTQISSKDANAGRARELQRWDAGPESTAVDMSLGDPNDGGEWDQFAVNERMYGVQSSYDEHIYTTAIDRNNPEFKRRQAEAERIAREIEGSAPANAHVAEERRRDAHRDDGGDEEDKYSGVRRESALPKRAQGAYVPPGQRPITGAPSVPGAPFDPAIISSQLKAVPSGPSQNTPSGPKPSTTPKVAIEPEAAPPRKKEGTTEDRVRDTADAFKQFANNEKLRIKAAQEAKKNTVRQEKNVKLNDLKKFAANFKLKSRVPDDLVPILAKDREKQLEIQSKAEEAAKEEELRSKDSDRANSAVASPVPSISTSQAGQTASDPRQPFNNQARAARSSQSGRGGASGPMPLHPGQMQAHGQGTSPRPPLSQRIGNNNLARQGMPTDLRIPASGPPGVPVETPMSPHSATRLNVNAKAFEFRPAASAFTPTGTSPSPARAISRAPVEPAPTFFDKDKVKTAKPFPAEYDPLKHMAEAEYTPGEKKKYAANGGLPQAYNTHPTWQTPKSNEQLFYANMFPQVQKAPTGSQGPSPMQTPSSNAQMPHAHQLPAHMHPQAMQAPNHRQQQFYPPQGHSFDPRLQQQHFGSNGSVQNSPRAQQMPVVPFNNQMAPISQPFPGQPMPPGYGMSPSMQYRQPHMQQPMMMMPGQPQGQMPMRPNNYGPGPQYNGPQMGGHMMVQQQSGGYANGPMPQNFSPMPPHAQPHMPHNMQQHGNQGFQGSPRPPMMSHQGSHQGFQPGMQMPSHFQPSPGQHHFHLQQQQRTMSGGYPQMTPRQQNAVPNHPSPGMGAPGQGDEGK